MDRLILNADLVKHKISRHLYGHFAEHLGRCIYDGIWVGENSAIPNTRGIREDVVAALRDLNIPNLRWPGGCFADEYHWEDGIGPRDRRPAMLNTHWGGVTEDNSFGTHEFMDLCGQLGCEPYICGNVGSGTVREMQQWIEYVTADEGPLAERRAANGREQPWKIRFWGVGNENWGCGGMMRPEYYADEYRRYACYCRDLGGNRLYRIACGPSGADYHWMEVLMREVSAVRRNLMQGIALHYYCGSGAKSRSATQFDEDDWFAQLHRAAKMDELIRRHVATMDQHDPDGNTDLIVDEWGAWHDVESGTNPRFLYQQNSLRDALVAGLTLNLFNHHSRRLRVANIAQTVNVLQAMVLTEGEKMLVTPTYHVFEMYKAHQNATLVPTHVDCGRYEHGDQSLPQVSASASRADEGTVTLTLCNLDPNHAVDLLGEVRGMELTAVSSRVLTAETITAHNTFDEPGTVAPVEFDGATLSGGKLLVQLPARSVVALSVG